jgi:transposase
LANLLQSGFFPEAHKASEEIYKLRLLLRERSFVVRMRTSVKNQLHGVATTQGLHNIKSGNPLHKKGKIGIMASDNFVLKELHQLNDMLERSIEPFDEKLKEEVKKYGDAILLMSMPGVGIVTALTIIAEVDNFNRFATPEKLTRYAGLVPRERSSGGIIKHGGITCEGSAPLRTVLVESAMRINENNAPALHAFVKRLTPITGAKKARIALARKMLGVMWKMIKDQKPYNKNILSFPNTTKVSDLEARTDA